MPKQKKDYINSKNKLSRLYRFKKKSGQIKNVIDNDTKTIQPKKARIIIRNISFNASELDIRELYQKFGQIEEIKLLKQPNGKLVGVGFVQFKNLEAASKAIFKTNKLNFLGRTISTRWAIPKSEHHQNLKKENENNEIKNYFKDVQSSSKQQNFEILEENKNNSKKQKNSLENNDFYNKLEQGELNKLQSPKKRARIVIRNLAFTITEDVLKKKFAKYGTIEELKILRKLNGSATGVSFLQFNRVQSAAQAIHHENMKNLLNRPMVIDWAIPKSKFEKSSKDENIKLNEDESNKIFKVTEEKIRPKNEELVNNPNENTEQNKREYIISDRFVTNKVSDEIDKKSMQLHGHSKSVISNHKYIFNDVSEGRTIFIKNIPFSTKNEDLKVCMEQFGPVSYALVCMDSLTEHSKGTAFVKFKNADDAQKCLSSEVKLKIHDQVLDLHKALHRSEIKEKNEVKTKKIRDSRNLYLVKEGVILVGSSAIRDISASDMTRRLQLEHWKSQMLRNFNMFVSKLRLVIHNLPTSIDNIKLRQLFQKNSNPTAIITEARVMRDLRNLDFNGVGKSKEYGFVSFTKHEDALKALRSLNNNPNIFTRAKRPIVAFSIENRIIINAKKKRLEKCRQKNLPYINYNSQIQKYKTDKNDEKNGNEINKKSKKACLYIESKGTTNEVASFIGNISNEGDNKLNGKYFFKKQAAMHVEILKQHKKKRKNIKQFKTNKLQALNEASAKVHLKQRSKLPVVDEVNLNRLVTKYKNKLSFTPNYKSKWYKS